MQWIEEPTILVTRFEYANLFHTVADWYNSAYVSSRVTNLPSRPNLVFVDGHCKVCTSFSLSHKMVQPPYFPGYTHISLGSLERDNYKSDAMNLAQVSWASFWFLIPVKGSCFVKLLFWLVSVFFLCFH